MQAPPRIIDLFSGCGGLTHGAIAAGLSPSHLFDIDPILTSSAHLNHPNAKLVLADLSEVSGDYIRSLVGGEVEGVFGGPPCQGFSSIGLRNPEDPRRSLLGHFFRLVRELEPAFFLMENVKGLGFKSTRQVLSDALTLVPSRYTLVGPLILDASEFGAATKRSRLFVLGYDRDRLETMTSADIDALKVPSATVRDAIADLTYATRLEDRFGYDHWKILSAERPSCYASGLRSSDGIFTGNTRTNHSAAVIKRFLQTGPGQTEVIGRHPRLHWDGQCPTLRAGTGNDRGSFQSVRPIHPDEPRVITVREAARLQGFPDSFKFHPTVWHSFRMIGNSVSPILSKALFGLIAKAYHRENPARG